MKYLSYNMPSKPCAVASCRNSEKSPYISLHRFPRDRKLREVWVLKCNRKDPFNPENSRICSAHFKPEEFKRDLRAELLRSRPKASLKPNVIPTLNLKGRWENLANEARQKRFLKKREKENVSEYPNPVKDPDYATHCDEEENYETSKSAGITIKVEPGLTDDMYRDDLSEEDTKGFLTGCSRLKEEANPDSMNQEELDSMIDVDNKTYIKQEDDSCLNSTNTVVKIKIEPGLSEHESHDCTI